MLTAAMRKLLAFVLCTAGMAGVYAIVRFLVLGISDDFGIGFLVGGGTIAGMIALAEHVSKPKSVL